MPDRLIREDPFEPERLFIVDGLIGGVANDRFTSTIAGGPDMACRDVEWKHLGVPVHQLFGMMCKDELRVYATAGTSTRGRSSSDTTTARSYTWCSTT